MFDVAKVLGTYGQFTITLTDGTVVECTVNSESKEFATYVVNTINRLDERCPDQGAK